MSDIVSSIEKIMGLEKHEIAESVIDSVPNMVPIMGGIMASVKYRRLLKRLDAIESKIEQIRDAISTEPNRERIEFIQNFAFPLFLQKLLEEDEELKLKYFINSINNTISAESLNESHLVLIFDLLDSLRCIEIDYLISLIDKNPFREDENLSQNMIKYIETKLEKLGLINMANSGKFTPDGGGIFFAYQNETVATELGKELVNFIS